MPSAGPKVLLLDLPLALAIGAATWVSAQAARWFDDRGPSLEGENGPWHGGPPYSPGGLEDVPAVWWLPLPFVLIMVGGLALRRLYPRSAFVAVILGLGGFLAVGGPYGPCLLAPALSIFTLASALPARQWAPLSAALVPMLVVGFWDEPYAGLLDPRAYGAVVVGLGAIMLPALIGLLLRNRRDVEATARTEELQRHAYEERLRVAREVHDVVGHSLSVINLQAGVALHVLSRQPERVEEALTAIKTTSKEALEELRSTLAVFRDPDLRLRPGAGLDRLADLTTSLRSAGREVIIDDQRSQALPAAVDQAAYRIVQESLTNIVRHTDKAAATVSLQTDHEQLLIMVADDGPPVSVVEGSGIVGMRERARAVGGRLSVSTGSSGVTVAAELPLAASDGRS